MMRAPTIRGPKVKHLTRGLTGSEDIRFRTDVGTECSLVEFDVQTISLNTAINRDG